jgi:5-methylthioribose kinase
MSYKAFNEEEAKEYALSIPGLFPNNAVLTSKEIGDGNLNLVFHIIDEFSGKSIIFKQALPYARVVGESWPLTLDRARIEYEALSRQRELCPSLVPQVYHYDAVLALTIMEDLSDHVIMRKGLTEGIQYPLFARDVATFLAHTLYYNSDFHLAPDVKKSEVTKYNNPELCKITEDLVFTDPFYDSETNSFNPLIQQDVESIWGDSELKKEIAKLKYSFLTSAQTLLHGDLHTGSIFVTQESTKVIDPEFAYFGPMGFDIGAVIANLLLNFAAQEGHMADKKEKEDFQHYLLNTIDQLWEHFEKEFKRLCLSETNDIALQNEAFINDFIDQIKKDSLGFAGCKILRRVIGLASVADLQSIEDPEVRAQAERIALYIGRELILKREKWSTGTSIQKEILHSLRIGKV